MIHEETNGHAVRNARAPAVLRLLPEQESVTRGRAWFGAAAGRTSMLRRLGWWRTTAPPRRRTEQGLGAGRRPDTYQCTDVANPATARIASPAAEIRCAARREWYATAKRPTWSTKRATETVASGSRRASVSNRPCQYRIILRASARAERRYSGSRLCRRNQNPSASTESSTAGASISRMIRSSSRPLIDDHPSPLDRPLES